MQEKELDARVQKVLESKLLPENSSMSLGYEDGDGKWVVVKSEPENIRQSDMPGFTVCIRQKDNVEVHVYSGKIKLRNKV